MFCDIYFLTSFRVDVDVTDLFVLWFFLLTTDVSVWNPSEPLLVLPLTLFDSKAGVFALTVSFVDVCALNYDVRTLGIRLLVL